MVVGDPGEDARGADAAPVHESKLSQHDVQCHHLSDVMSCHVMMSDVMS